MDRLPRPFPAFQTQYLTFSRQTESSSPQHVLDMLPPYAVETYSPDFSANILRLSQRNLVSLQPVYSHLLVIIENQHKAVPILTERPQTLCTEYALKCPSILDRLTENPVYISSSLVVEIYPLSGIQISRTSVALSCTECSHDVLIILEHTFPKHSNDDIFESVQHPGVKAGC